MIFLQTPRSILSMRLLLAVLLMFGSEILLWNDPTGKPIIEWLLPIPGYIALSMILLDFVVRYRARDLFSSLVLSGIFSLGAALIIYPQSAFVDMPRTLVTRVMGAHALIGAEMIGVFLVLTGGSHGRTQRNLLIGCVVVGLAWGFWVKDWPAEEGFSSSSLVIMLAFGVVGLVIVWILARDAASSANRGEVIIPDNLKLSPRAWGSVVIVLAVLFGIRVIQFGVDGGAIILTALLLVLSWAILWFRGRTKGETLLDGHVPPVLPSFSSFLIAALLFFGVGAFVFNLAPIHVANITPITIIGLGFTGYGLAWLPTVSLVLGGRAYLRQIQTQKL